MAGRHNVSGTVGEGFVGIVDDDKDFEEHRKAASDGINFAIDQIANGNYRLIILDELNVALHLKLVTRPEVERILSARDEKQHLVITGRDAPDWLINKADLVTEMTEIKHPFQKGMLAQKGIDW